MGIGKHRGDSGQTDLRGGRRVSKASLRVEACGSLDELSSALGLVLAKESTPRQVRQVLEQVQSCLFELGSDLALGPDQPEEFLLAESRVGQIEDWMEQFSEGVPVLKNFILPGGNGLGARLHWVRALCRRVERRVQSLAGEESINPAAIPYLNRLADLLFALARWENHRRGFQEVQWKSRE